MTAQDAKARAIWKQHTIPVVYRKGQGTPLLVKLPYSFESPYYWLKGDGRKKPIWNKQFTCWQVPNAWFNKVIARTLEQHGQVWVIQPYRVMEKCAPACWNAEGFDCECSCMGANHGSQSADNWFVISETCAVSWHERELACRLIEIEKGVLE